MRLDWEPDNGLLADFRGHLEQLGMPLGDEQFENEKAYLHRSLKKNVYKSAFHLYEGMRVDIELDPAVRRAAQLFPEARALLKRAEKTLAQNTKLTSDP